MSRGLLNHPEIGGKEIMGSLLKNSLRL